MLQARLTSVRYVTPDINLYEFRRVDGQPVPAADPGAHVELRLPNGIVRQYSVTNPGAAPHAFRIAVKRDPASAGGSSFIHDVLRVGQVIEIGAPRNNFQLAEDAPHTAFFAGGIGVTPIWGMVQRLSQLGRSYELYYACRSRADAAFLEDLEKLGPVSPHFDDECGAVLPVADLLAAVRPDAHVYCCGPAPMLKAFEEAAAGRPERCVHVEYFTARYEPARDYSFTVVLAKSGLELTVGQGESIMEVVRRAGIEVLSSCEQGICGACEKRVLEGEPDHRDAILSAEERAAGKTMMICCSGSKTSRLVLDL